MSAPNEKRCYPNGHEARLAALILLASPRKQIEEQLLPSLRSVSLMRLSTVGVSRGIRRQCFRACPIRFLRRALYRKSVILSPGSTVRAPLAEILAGAAESPGSFALEEEEPDHIIRSLREADAVVSFSPKGL